jgi:hypothetical protein
MPWVRIKFGFEPSSDNEEVLTEYLCDWPDCPNLAVHTLGCVKELLGATAALCDEHAQTINGSNPTQTP